MSGNNNNSRAQLFTTGLLAFLAGAAAYPAARAALSALISNILSPVEVDAQGNTVAQVKELETLLQDNLGASQAYEEVKKEKTPPPPCILVVGSANADLYIETATLAKPGETLGGSTNPASCGGKGINQCAAAKKSFCIEKLTQQYGISTTGVQFIGVLGTDAHGEMFINAARSIDLDISQLFTVDDTPTGVAYIMLDAKANNSIIVCPGANMVFPPQYHLYPQMFTENGEIIMSQEECEEMFAKQQQQEKTSTTTNQQQDSNLQRKQCILEYIPESLLKSLQTTRCCLLQREIPDTVNFLLAYVIEHMNSFYNFSTLTCKCRDHHNNNNNTDVDESNNNNNNNNKEEGIINDIPRILTHLDVGGLGMELDLTILNYISFLSFNETEMGRSVQQAFAIAQQTLNNSQIINQQQQQQQQQQGSDNNDEQSKEQQKVYINPYTKVKYTFIGGEDKAQKIIQNGLLDYSYVVDQDCGNVKMTPSASASNNQKLLTESDLDDLPEPEEEEESAGEDHNEDNNNNNDDEKQQEGEEEKILFRDEIITLLNDYTIFSNSYATTKTNNNDNDDVIVQLKTQRYYLSKFFHPHLNIKKNKKLYSIFFGRNKKIDLNNLIHAANVMLSVAGRIPEQYLTLNNNTNSISFQFIKPTKLSYQNKKQLQLLVTLGKHGSIVMGYNQIIHYQPPLQLQTQHIVDSTGCGDAYRGSFAAALVECFLTSEKPENKNENQQQEKQLNYLQYLSYAMKIATCTACLCLSRKGTLPAMPQRDEIDLMMRRFF